MAQLFEKRDNKLYYKGKYFVGEIFMDVDGMYKFFPDLPAGGYLDIEFILNFRQIADILQELNAEYEAQLTKNLSKLTPTSNDYVGTTICKRKN